MNLYATLTLSKAARQTSAIFATAVFLIMPLSSPVIAQGDEPANASIKEIVVTATKRETALQDAPLSVSALNQEGLEQRGADDFLDLVGSISGLTVRDSGPIQIRPIIRGLSGVGESQVGIYFDEVPVTDTPGTSHGTERFSHEIKPFDVNRVEVLKGPQGALYGSSSMGGTVRFIFNKPDATDFSAKISAETSSVSEGGIGSQINGMDNIPLIKGVLALRMVAYWHHDAGFIDDTLTGESDVNEIDTQGTRLALRWTPFDSLALTVTTHLQNQSRKDAPFFIVAGRNSGTTINGIPDLLAPVNSSNNLKSSLKTEISAKESSKDLLALFNVTLENDFGWANLFASFSDFAYGYYDDFRAGLAFYDNADDGTGLTPPPPPPFQPYVGLQPLDSNLAAAELRLTSPRSSRLAWNVGILSQKREADSIAIVGSSFRQIHLLEQAVTSLLEEQALYAELTFRISDRLALTGGARVFSIETKSNVLKSVGFVERRINLCAALGIPAMDCTVVTGGFSGDTTDVCSQLGVSARNCITTAEGDEEGETFRLHLSYELSDDLLLYGQFSQGYRAGGANINSAVANLTGTPFSSLGVTPRSYQADTVDSYEVGFRSTWLDRRLALNAAAYTMQWDDIQIQARDAEGLFPFVVNGEAAKV